MYAFSENFILPFSHDEVVHLKKAMLTKMPGDNWQRFANLRALYVHVHPPRQKTAVHGWGIWPVARVGSRPQSGLAPDTVGRASPAQRFVADLNRLYRQEPAMHEVDFSWKGFDWINFRDVDKSIIAFERRANDVNDRPSLRATSPRCRARVTGLASRLPANTRKC